MELLEGSHNEGLILIPKTDLIPSTVREEHTFVQNQISTLSRRGESVTWTVVP
jgi:hypothetical protein